LAQAAASRDSDPAAAIVRRASRWSFLRCMATWMPGGSGGMTATGTDIWTHLRNDHD
jgi:hypothetical protein